MYMTKGQYYQMGVHKQLIFKESGIFCKKCNKDHLTVCFPKICHSCYIELCQEIVKEIENIININAYYFKYNTMKKQKGLLPKDLIFDSLESKLEGENIERIIMTFGLHEKTSSIGVKHIDVEKYVEYHLEKKERRIIMLMFINKIKRLIEADKYKDIIIQLSITDKDFKIYLQDFNNEVTQFNYQN